MGATAFVGRISFLFRSGSAARSPSLARRNAASAEAARAQDRNHREREFFHVGIELVGVPAEQQVAAVRIDGADHALGRGDLDLVLEAVPRERGVVRLDVELEMLFEAEGAEEGDAARDVEIVLVFRRLLRLRLDQELTLEADALGVIDRQVQERSKVVLFAFQIGVEQRLVALAPAPENIVLAAEFLGDFERLLHLRGGIGEDVGVGIRGGAGKKPRIAE